MWCIVRRNNDTVHLIDALLQIVVHHDILIFLDTERLLRRTLHTLLDHFRRFRTPALQPVSEFLRPRRHDKKRQSVRILLLHLIGPLNLNLQNDVPAVRQLLLHVFPRCPVIIVTITGVFYQPALRNLTLELLFFQEKIFPAVHFSGPGFSGRCRNRQRIPVIFLHQPLDQGAFPRSRKPGNNNQNTFTLHLSLRLPSVLCRRWSPEVKPTARSGYSPSPALPSFYAPV